MSDTVSSMKNLVAASLLLVSAAGILRADPDAESILAAARVNPLGERITLNAQLRADSTTVPFQIRVSDGTIAYVFEKPDQEILLGLGEKSASLNERRGGKTSPVAPAKYDDPVRGGLLTYEDLALRFLYWPNPRLLGSETLRSRPAFKIEIAAPASESDYGVVRLWIDKESGALLRIEGFNKEGRLAKRFEVVSAQKLGGQWMLKQMRVERLDPATRKVTGRTYLEVLGRADKPSA